MYDVQKPAFVAYNQVCELAFCESREEAVATGRENIMEFDDFVCRHLKTLEEESGSDAVAPLLWDDLLCPLLLWQSMRVAGTARKEITG